MLMYFAILAASLFAATSLASPVSAQSMPKPADQAQPSTRSDDDPDADEAGADEAGADDSGAQLDSFRRPRDPCLAACGTARGSCSRVIDGRHYGTVCQPDYKKCASRCIQNR